jgi:hypothetical protein
VVSLRGDSIQQFVRRRHERLDAFALERAAGVVEERRRRAGERRQAEEEQNPRRTLGDGLTWARRDAIRAKSL